MRSWSPRNCPGIGVRASAGLEGGEWGAGRSLRRQRTYLLDVRASATSATAYEKKVLE
jgi:hypothetical protein